jgi:hypothetical protein
VNLALLLQRIRFDEFVQPGAHIERFRQSSMFVDALPQLLQVAAHMTQDLADAILELQGDDSAMNGLADRFSFFPQNAKRFLKRGHVTGGLGCNVFCHAGNHGLGSGKRLRDLVDPLRDTDEMADEIQSGIFDMGARHLDLSGPHGNHVLAQLAQISTTFLQWGAIRTRLGVVSVVWLGHGWLSGMCLQKW